MGLKHYVHQLVLRIGSYAKGTRHSNHHFFRTAYKVVKNVSESQVVIYEGYRFHIQPSETVARRINIDGGHEKAVRDAIHQKLEPGDVAIDLGAHYGNHTLSMAKAVGPDGRVVAFEPHPTTVSHLSRTIEDNSLRQVQLVDKAVSVENSTVKMVASGSSTFRSRNELASEKEFETTVETIQLSEYLDENSINKVDLMKVDIEGAESEVFKDLRSELRRFDCIILEFHDQILTASEIEKIFNQLTDHGSLETISGKSITSVGHLSGLDDHLIWTAA